ncbi:MAG: AAA family ATPase [Gammaproteobacteria bacterium]|nr:AAA family ATPase [Gammaproteobacteria bacterium]
MMDPREADPVAALRRLVESVRDHARFNHPAPTMAIVETHISIILLTGPYAYKFKKPLDLGFLDFTTLPRRKHYCEEELRLNRRLAPRHYLEVVSITGPQERPVLGGSGPVLEYAVRMLQFPREMELDRIAAREELTPDLVDRLAEKIARFHASATIADAGSRHGSIESIRDPALANLSQLAADPALAGDERVSLRQLEEWTRVQCHALHARFQARQEHGGIRECHGDMHLGNIVLHDGELVIFDCVEFSEGLRWIDVIDEVAFLMMDLRARAGTGPAWRFLNAWLEHSGDYGGLGVLNFYLAYRALVRAKIASIRLQQPGFKAEARAAETASRQIHLSLARGYSGPRTAALLIAFGLSGSGKTSVTQDLLERLGAVRVRSDIERKRLHGLAALEASGSATGAGIYSEAATGATYGRLAQIAAEVLEAGHCVIIDAACLRREQRACLEGVARERGAPWVILEVSAREATLRRRMNERRKVGGDASEADARVLDYQIANLEPLDGSEQAARIRIDTEAGVEMDSLCGQISSKLVPER